MVKEFEQNIMKRTVDMNYVLLPPGRVCTAERNEPAGYFKNAFRLFLHLFFPVGLRVDIKLDEPERARREVNWLKIRRTNTSRRRNDLMPFMIHCI
jgi:hypothetical protein